MSFLASSIVLLILSLVSSNALSTEWCCSVNVVLASLVLSSSENVVAAFSASLFVDILFIGINDIWMLVLNGVKFR